MANPNVVGVQTVRGKTTVRTFVKKTPTTFLMNNANSGEVLKINSLYVANKHTTSVNVTVQMIGPSTQYVSQNVVDSITVASGSSIVLVSKNTDLYLTENTSLSMTATQNDVVSLVCSYEQISDGTPADRNDNVVETEDPYVSTNLVLYFDANNTSSYPGSGTTWTDVSGNTNNGTLVNGPTYSSLEGGYLNFDGVDDHISIGSQSIVGSGSQPFTVEIWFYNTRTLGTGAYTMLFRVKQDTEFFGVLYNPSGTYNVYSTFRNFTQWGTPVTNSDYNNKWICAHFVYTGGDKNTAASFKNYINGTQIPTATNNFGAAGGAASNCNLIGADGNSGCNAALSGYHGGRISIYRLYNRELSAAEITRNFNGSRGRYGI